MKSPPLAERFPPFAAIKAQVDETIAEAKKLQATGIYPIKRERTQLQP
jgi:hypothetical protein